MNVFNVFIYFFSIEIGGYLAYRAIISLSRSLIGAYFGKQEEEGKDDVRSEEWKIIME